jgi:hypothetical protein
VEAQVLEARRGPRAALDFLADVAGPSRAGRRRPRAGRRDRHGHRRGGARQPTLAFIRASAEHAEGLLTSDVSLLQHASAQLPDLWARACAVEDQGVLLAAAGRDREPIRSLKEALREYDRLGARRGE